MASHAGATSLTMQSETIRKAIGLYDDILTTVKKRKLKWFGHVSISAGLAKASLQGTVQGGRRRGNKISAWRIISLSGQG